MADDEPIKPRSKRWMVYVAAAAPIVYVLSFGPVMWTLKIMARNAPLSVFELANIVSWRIYAALIWSAGQMPWLRRFLDWYHDLIG